MTPQVGDIVTVTRHPGRWVVAYQIVDAIPPGRIWRVISENSRQSFSLSVGDGDMVLLKRPQISIGMHVTHAGDIGEVVAINGDIISVHQTKERQFRGGETHIWSGVTDVQRADVVLDNLSTFLNQP